MLDTARQVLSFQHGAQASEAERGKSPDIRVGFVGSIIREWIRATAWRGTWLVTETQATRPCLIDTSTHTLWPDQSTAVRPGRASTAGTSFSVDSIGGASTTCALRSGETPVLVQIETLTLREESSNNRVKSGYKDRARPPIERVPDAGSKTVSRRREHRTRFRAHGRAYPMPWTSATIRTPSPSRLRPLRDYTPTTRRMGGMRGTWTGRAKARLRHAERFIPRR